MKRMLILVVIAMLAGPLFAEEATLIDFTLLKADIIELENPRRNGPVFAQNRQTLMDFSHVAGGSFTTQQKGLMKTSLAIENWEVRLSSSSQTVESIGLSYAREATSKGFWGEELTVMGVRVRFPTEPFNSWASIRPPFEIPAFEPQVEIDENGNISEPEEGNDGITTPSRFESQGTDDNDNKLPAYGVVKNVGTIKSVAVNVYGLNFPHGLYVTLIDNQGIHRNIFMGYLLFDGWGELVWQNPQYIQEVRNRDIRLYPLYPTSTPFIKFGGFIVQRDAAKAGGDFIVYFKDVKVIYDLAVLDTNADIDDEALWGIIQDRETARKAFEMERFGQAQVLRYIESQKQANDIPFQDRPRPVDQREQQQE